MKISPIKSQNWNVSRLVLQLFLPNPFKPSVKSINDNEDVVGAAPTGDDPTTTEWSTILLPNEVRLVSKIWRNYRWKWIHVIY